MSFDITPTIRDFILRHEGFAGHPYWPKGASGVTLDFGYDLGWTDKDEFNAAWGEVLPVDAIVALRRVIGLKGVKAKLALPNVQHFRITRGQANAVFYSISLPKWTTHAEGLFPGIAALPPNARGALVSLIYNRGTNLGKTEVDSTDSEQVYDRRFGMALVRKGVSEGNLDFIADSVAAMEEFHEDEGLKKRRREEAALIRSALGAI